MSSYCICAVVMQFKLGSFSNDGGDGNENVKKATGLITKKKILCTCIILFGIFPCRHCTTRTDGTFHVCRKHTTTFFSFSFSFFLNSGAVSNNSAPANFTYFAKIATLQSPLLKFPNDYSALSSIWLFYADPNSMLGQCFI